MEGIFYKANNEYVSKMNPLRSYLEQLTYYIKTKKGLDHNTAEDIAKQIIRKHYKDPDMVYFGRDENGDKIVERGSLYNYISTNIREDRLIAPTLTTYVPRSEKKSMLSEYTSGNTKARSLIKKQAHIAKAEGRLEEADALNIKQNGKKIDNNSLSGVYSKKSCVVYNPTAHSTLTSITRIITSLSNASNEMLLAGNRYLPRPSDALNHVVYLSKNCKIDQMKLFLQTYQLKLLTVEDVVKVLKWSTDLYFKDQSYYDQHIIPFLQRLTPEQLSFIGYVSDFYHIRQFNPEFMKNLISETMPKIVVDEPLEDPNVLYSIDGAILCFVHTIFYYEVQGFGTDYVRMNSDGLANSLYQTSLAIMEVLEKYKLFYNTIIMHEVFPTNSFRLRNMLRRLVVLSDTDSTCCALDEWVTWLKGEFVISGETISLAGLLSFVATQSIVHKLAEFSKRMGVDEELLKVLQMKNEYLWTVHVPTNLGKHYFAYTVFQEGNVFPKPDIEIKGVHLKSSAVPLYVSAQAEELMHYILGKIHNNEKISLRKVVEDIIKVEDTIIERVRSGDSDYLRRTKVKDMEAYADGPKRSPYQRHTFWQTSFAKKYKPVEEPPYTVVKFPTTLVNKTALTEWLGSMDEQLSKDLTVWLQEHGKTSLPTLYVNKGYIEGYGLPEEIDKIIDIKRIVLDITAAQRVILESLGVILNEDMMVKEQFMNFTDKPVIAPVA